MNNVNLVTKYLCRNGKHTKTLLSNLKVETSVLTRSVGTRAKFSLIVRNRGLKSSWVLKYI